MAKETPGSDPSGARSLLEKTARAFPAQHIEQVDGWWLRHAPGCAWWVGTVLAHGAVPAEDLVSRIAEAEKFYARHGSPSRFEITPGVCAEGLDTLLAERGYRRRSLMSLQAASTARVRRQAPAGGLRVRWDDRPTRAWFDAWHVVHGHGRDVGPDWDLLHRVTQPSAYACAMLGDEVVAVGRAVAEDGWAGVFGMATLPQARGQGAAASVLAALATWAGEQGINQMYLQVERDNPPALRLYERAGFSEVCGYHFRVAESP